MSASHQPPSLAGIVRLCKLKMECSNILSAADNSKIVESIVRLAVLLLTLLTSAALTVYCHTYYYTHVLQWHASLRQYILLVMPFKADMLIAVT